MLPLLPAGASLWCAQDTVKTRLTTQSVAAAGAAAVKYSGVLNCFQVVLREEGVGALYRALPPRLLSVARTPQLPKSFSTRTSLNDNFF